MIENLPEAERKALLRETFYLHWYNAIDRGQGMSDFFTEILDFKKESVIQYRNLSKTEIIEVLGGLQQESQKFNERMKRDKTEGNLAICVIWVGHSLNSKVKVH